jgi:adenylate cyclase
MFKKLRAFAGLALVLTAFMSLALSQGFFQGTQLKIQNRFYDFNRPSQDLVMVAIDEKTLQEDALGPLTKWPRENYVKLIEALNQAGAKAIGIDVTFPDLSALGPEDDGKLRDALAQNPNVVLGSRFYYDHDQKGAELPNEVLMEAHPKLGWLNVQLDVDNYIRKLPVYTQWNGVTTEAFALQMARIGDGSVLTDSSLFNSEYHYTDEVRIPVTLAYDKKANETVPLMAINYFSEPFGYTHVSMIDVLNGKFIDKTGQPVDFKNKYVFVGPTALDLQDYYQSPLSEGVRMPGVEVHANALQTILERAFLKDQSAKSLWGSVLGILLLNILIFAFLKVRYAVPIFTLELMGVMIAGLVGYEMGIFVNVVHPLLAVILSFVGSFLTRYILESRERKFLKGAFGHYVSATVVEELIKNPKALELGGVKREITSLFSDIANFTTISEGLDPQDLVKFLNEYFTEMTAIVFKHGGTLDKFEGDAIVAFWGAPLEEKAHASKAAKAALEMQERLKDLRAKWAAEKKPTITIRIGLNTGIAVVGNMGSAERFDYTAMGDTVNLASRLEGANKQYGTAIMIGENTYAALAGTFATRELDSIRVKGKNKAIKVYELGNQNAVYEKALAEYRSKNFTAAAQTLDALSKTDSAAKVLKERCDHYLKNPPPSDWDGVWTFTTK